MAKTASAAKKAQRDPLEKFLQSVIKGLQEKKAKHITLLDLRSLEGAVADAFVVCEGNSATQVEALARSVEEVVSDETGENPAHLEGLKNAQWVLIDYIHVVVHIFQPETRAFYGVERLWADGVVREIIE